MFVAGGAELGDHGIGHRFGCVVDGVAEVGGGPEDAGVGGEGVAVGLAGLVFVAGVRDLGSLGEE